jgi:MFS family permease
MEVTTTKNEKENSFSKFLFHHEIDAYPQGPRRIGYLALAVLATITLYYTYYTQTGVTPQLLQSFHMSFAYYVGIVVVSNALGAFASLPASRTDRFGRSNVVIYGLLIVGLIVSFGVTNAHSALTFGIAISAMGIVEGAVLVATPALIRDFSPQVGRASAMGFWTVGPVAGSLIVSIVAAHTLSHFNTWQSQFWISGITSLVVFLICLVLLKDLSPAVRDQVTASEQERILVNARAQGLSEETIHAEIARPWKQILSWRLLGSSLGISLFLLIYYIAASFFTIYYVVTFAHPNGLPFTTTDANSLNQWFWGADIVSLIFVGWLSDRLRVRKPFMVVGTVLSIIFTIIFLTRATQPHTSFTTLAILGVLIAFSLSVTYAPWMAGYTETVEARNPALVGTGLALWGWVLRIVVAVSFIFLPIVIPSVSPIVNNTALVTSQIPNCIVAPATATEPAIAGPAVPAGTSASTFSVEHADSVSFAQQNSALLQKVSANYRVVAAASAPNASLADLGKALAVLGPKDAAQLVALKSQFQTLVVPYACQLNYLAAHQGELLAVTTAQKQSPQQWQRWFWIDVAGMVLFLPTIFLTKGPWSPKKARKEFEDREMELAAAIAELPPTK